MSALLILRHARSTWNEERRWQGQADPPLSDTGREQIARAAATLRSWNAGAPVPEGPGVGRPAVDLPAVDLPAIELPAIELPAIELPAIELIVTSDLDRARHTGELLAAHLGLTGEHVVEPGLREYDVGEWSGRTRAQIEAGWPAELADFDAGRLPGPPGGETRAAFDIRVQRAAGRLCRLLASAGSARTLVVTHGGVIRSLARSAGRADTLVGHLAGYHASAATGSVSLAAAVDLLGQPTPVR